jgi:hypothetical protein
MLVKVLIYMILFFLVASPATFKLMRKLLGGWVASAEGIPHAPGLLLHSAVYVLLACYIPAKLVSSFAEDFEDEKYEDEKYEDEKYMTGGFNSSAKSAPQYRGHASMADGGMELYIGEFGATKNPFGVNTEKRNESSGMF